MTSTGIIIDDDDEISVVQEGGFFSLQRVHTEIQIVRKLGKLRDENFPTEIDFTVHGILLTDRISHAMIETFQHYANAGRRWNEASFYDFEADPTNNNSHLLLLSVLQSAVDTQMFRRYTFSNELIVERPLTNEFATTIAHVLRNGQYLERVTIHNFEINNTAMTCLARGLATDTGSVAPKKLEFHDIRFTTVEDEEALMDEQKSAEEYLAEGLARNTTLASVSFSSCHLSDSSMNVIIQSLIGHPSLKELALNFMEFGEATTRSICRLLACPTCQLSDLQMVDHVPVAEEGDAEFDLERLVGQLPTNNRSLQSLTLTDHAQSIDHDGANLLLRCLWKFPSLKSLDLSTNSICDLERLAHNLTTTTRPQSRLRILDLDDNDYAETFDLLMDDEHAIVRAILHLLGIFPELGYLGEDFADAIDSEFFPASVAERIDMNRCSGLLLRGGTIPLSVWPVVLAKVNSDRFLQAMPSRKANVLYHMLHGPVFVGRGALD